MDLGLLVNLTGELSVIDGIKGSLEPIISNDAILQLI